MEDLYSGESGDFVFGEANPATKTGVFSFARYTPSKKSSTTQALSQKKYALLLRRSCQVMVHEVIHLFNVEVTFPSPSFVSHFGIIL